VDGNQVFHGPGLDTQNGRKLPKLQRIIMDKSPSVEVLSR